ncbi:Transglutaminase elicitor [Candidatus Electrothrix gigas]
MATPEGKHNCFLLNLLKSFLGKPAPEAGEASQDAVDPSAHPSAETSGPPGTPDTAETAETTETAESSSQPSNEQGEQENKGLEELKADPVAFMDKLPVKYDEQGEPLDADAVQSLFDEKAIQEKAFVDARDTKRQEITELEAVAAGRAAFAENDQADGFTDTFPYSGLQGMEDNGLMRARLPEQPWSDDYWAIYLGILGKRYADYRFPNSQNWKVNYDYIQGNPAMQILASGNSDAINRLSPSEKYDILVGDQKMTLTQRMWEEGKKYYSRTGKVEPWMGLCHGWAPAAYMLPRPTNSTTVLAADGKTYITFYPADIKALATLLWAKVRTSSRFIGGRCNDKSPAVDPQNGRILSQRCFDTNPGTWHLAVINQIGASQRSMILDATYDYEVWNQPIVAYTYRYFNPQKMYYARSLAEASVAKASFTRDRFQKYRDSETETVVGIAMDISYMVETRPEQHSTDSASSDRVQQVRYYYDLELDGMGNIIGGEWYQNAHPDFLWTPEKGSRAVTYWEGRYGLAGDWKSEEVIPREWQEIAAVTSGYQKAPLAAVVEQLINFTQPVTRSGLTQESRARAQE